MTDYSYETADKKFFKCSECGCETVPNPYPNYSVKEVECHKCNTIHEIEWIDDTQEKRENVH